MVATRPTRVKLIPNLNKRTVFTAYVEEFRDNHQSVLLTQVKLPSGEVLDHLWVKVLNYKPNKRKFRFYTELKLVGYGSTYERSNGTFSLSFDKVEILWTPKYKAVHNKLFHLRNYCGMLELIGLAKFLALQNDTDTTYQCVKQLQELLAPASSRIRRKIEKKFLDNGWGNKGISEYIKGDYQLDLEFREILIDSEIYESSVLSGFAKLNLRLIYLMCSKFFKLKESKEDAQKVKNLTDVQVFEAYEKLTLRVQVEKLMQLK